MMQVIHDIEEPSGLFIPVSQVLNCLAAYQVLGNLSPHLSWRRRWRRTRPRGYPAVNIDIKLPTTLVYGYASMISRRCGPWSRRRLPRYRDQLPVSFWDELCSSNTAVLGPVGLGACAPCAIHSYPFRTRRDIDDGPILGGAAPCLTHPSA